MKTTKLISVKVAAILLASCFSLAAFSAPVYVNTHVALQEHIVTYHSEVQRWYNGSGFWIGGGTGLGTNASVPTVGDSGPFVGTEGYLSSFNTYTSAGSTDTTGTLTSAYDSLQGTGQKGGGASAYAAANLADGTLHVSAGSSFEGPEAGIDTGTAAQASALLADNLHFTINGATQDTHTQIQIEYKVDGTESTAHDTPYGYQRGVGRYGVYLGGVYLWLTSDWTPVSTDPNSYSPHWTSESIAGFNSWVKLLDVNYISHSPTALDAVLTFDLIGSSIDAGFYTALAMSCSYGVSCDFNNTAATRFILPTNVSFTSDSGVALTQDSGMFNVPVPATIWLFGLALPLLRYFGKRM